MMDFGLVTLRVLVPVALAGALLGCRDVATCGSADRLFEGTLDDAGSVAVYLSSEGSGGGGFAPANIALLNLDEQATCAYAVYEVVGHARPEDVPVVDETSSARSLPAGYELVSEGVLPRAGSHRRYVEVEAYLQSGRGDYPDVDLSLVVVACDGAQVELALDLSLLLCKPGDHPPAFDPDMMFRRLW